MSNFVSNSDATTLFEAVGKKKLTVTDTMPTAAEANVGVSYLYLGADTQDFEEGGVYKCQEVTPATDPKTYEYIHIFTAKVDLSLYKRIFGGTVAAWDLLTDEQKAQYEYTFFDGDSNDYFAVVDAVTDGDMHPVTSNAVAEEVEDLDAEIADIVNVYGAKNLLPNLKAKQYANGIEFLCNLDGSVTVNGTASANTGMNIVTRYKGLPSGKLIFSKGISNDDAQVYLNLYNGNTLVRQVTNLVGKTEYEFNNDYSGYDSVDVGVYVVSGKSLSSVTFYPMIRLASIKDDTFEPYAPTNFNAISSDTNAELGAHQYIDYDLDYLIKRNTYGTWDGNSYTLNGVTFTVNDDLSISATGQATAQTEFYVHYAGALSGSILKKNTSYIASMCSKKGSMTTFRMVVYGRNSDSQTTFDFVTNSCDGFKFDHSQDSYYFNFAIRIMNGHDPNGMTFYPLIRLATDPSTKFTPYAKTNKELTDVINTVKTITPTFTGATFLDGAITQNNKHISMNIRIKLKSDLAANSSVQLATGMPLPKGYVPFFAVVQSATNQNMAFIDTEGKLTFHTYIALSTAPIIALSVGYDIA